MTPPAGQKGVSGQTFKSGSVDRDEELMLCLLVLLGERRVPLVRLKSLSNF